MTEASRRAALMRPLSTARRSPLNAAAWSGELSTMSLPASTARTAASPASALLVTPAMPIESVMARPVEPEIGAQQAVDDRLAEGGRIAAVVDGGETEMRGHHGVGLGGNRGAERRELDVVEMRPRMRDRGEPEMRIDVGVAVSREVLERGHRAASREPAHPGRGEGADTRRIRAVRAGVDDRILRVVVDVGDGREVQVDAERAGFAARTRWPPRRRAARRPWRRRPWPSGTAWCRPRGSRRRLRSPRRRGAAPSTAPAGD